MKSIFLIAFFIISAIHLYHSYIDAMDARRISKPFLVLMVILFYVSASSVRDPLLIAALVLCWLGDVLLIPKGNKWFIFGGIAFLISHALFILVNGFRIDWHQISVPVILVAAAVYLFISFRIIKAIIAYMPKTMAYAMYLYLFFNSTMNLTVLVRLLQNTGTSTILNFIGAICFFISDCVLFLVRYHPNMDLIFKRHFTVMLTYLAAILLITLGVLTGE